MLFALIMLTSSVCFDAGGVRETPPPAASAQFAYDAINPKNKRKSPAIKHGSEDLLLKPSDRSKLTSNARDIARNYAVAAWMIRKHLDYVSTFDFQMRTEDDGLNDAIEALWDDWSRPQNCDAAGRHPLPKMLRLAEARRTVDGDVFLLKLSDGRLQAIEGDRIRDPMGHGPFLPAEPAGGAKWIHGVKCDPAGRALAYAIHKRSGINSYQFERTVAASKLCHFGYYDRFDQVRGISPLATALNPLRDTYEVLDLAIVKAKVSQLFGIKFTRAASESPGELTGGVDADGNENKSKYEVDFGRNGLMLDLDAGDDAAFLESATPSTQFQEFVKVSIMLALKALDIPASVWDEAHTNFYGSRSAWIGYRRSCEDKWRDAIELRRKITVWRLALWVLDGTIPLKKSQTISDLAFEFRPAGFEFWDPAKEINAAVQEIKAGITNPIAVCRERGTDFRDNIDETAKAIEYAKAKGVPVEFALAPPAPVNVVEANDA